METAFTPLASLGGGALIGLAAVLLMAFHGRIFGATGIVGGLLRFDDAADWRLRAAVLAGMIVPALVLGALGAAPQVQIPITGMEIAVGGFIVGLGVYFGNGCPSGHGVCGIARLSPRSIIGTMTFMATAFATVFVIRHLIGG